MSEMIENKNDRVISAKFKPRARLLLQLGDQLIKNESIALVELVKNSYDADANNVIITMESVDKGEDGLIVIKDDGYGMTVDIVENVWLEPGSDFKAVKLKKLETSPKYNRLPIGEKGIGRFGVHKLGNVIEMTTKSKSSKEVFVRIDWSIFDDYRYLEDVPIKIIEREESVVFKSGETGTLIVIRNLRNDWSRVTARTVKRSITALVSPFDSLDSFKPKFNILDKPEWFTGLLLWEQIKDYSLFHFKIQVEVDKIKNFLYEFTPWASMPKISGRIITQKDDLLDAFKNLEDLDGRRISLAGLNVGDYSFEGYIFDLDAFILKLGVTDKTGFKNYLRHNGGVRVFRDGLRVYDYGEPENDWLGLDFRRFQQPTKAISNNLILGAVYLNREKSSGLIEKTNREGFVENESYISFRESILHCIRLIEILREKDKKRLKEAYGPTPKSSPVMHLLYDMKEYVERRIEEKEIKDELNKYIHKIEADYKRVTENLLKAAGAGLSMSVVVHEVEKILFEVTKVLELENSSDRLIKLVRHLSSLIDGYSEIIRKSNQSAENIKQIIEQSLFNTEFRLSSHGIEVISSYKNYNGTTKINISRSLIIGCLMNIIDNSIYWIERAYRGNDKIKKEIYIGLEEDNNFLYVIVADTGTGFLIPTEDVTEPFVSAKPGGMGLGLHITSEIMQAQEGKLVFPEIGDFNLPKEFISGAIVCLAFKK